MYFYRYNPHILMRTAKNREKMVLWLDKSVTHH
ncbi:hypothetical protein YPS_0835 [Yersinia pestis Pestoides A]|nr:hypothetical protein YPS_0835 [Yersinia pestis Pestoides A]